MRISLVWKAAAGCALAVLLSGAPLAAQGAEPLRPGDAVRLASAREDQLAGTFGVDETGTVSLPLLGPRTVSDLPAAQLKQRLQRDYGARLGENQYVEITLLRRVRVLGGVKNPGIYHVDATMGLGDVVALAGGATREGDLDRVRVVRDGRAVPAGELQAGAGTLHSGDEIVIPERAWLARNAPVVVGATISAVAIIVSRLVD